jgi:Raf kinase inhibitor-like YbhB/YbcL family protein
MRTLLTTMSTLAAAVSLTAGAAPAQAQTFALGSPDIASGATISQTHAFNGFGCTGQNVSPALTWRNAPSGTRSFALMVHDPDAPTGGAGFWHWVAIDLPASVSTLPRGSGDLTGSKLPTGARQVATDFGTPGWGGPCPSVGDRPHRYVFTLYALKVDRLEVPANATASLTGFMVNANAIGRASFTALYGR